MAEGRRRESLEEYFLPFDQEELKGIEAICLDMHDPYIAAVRARVPDPGDKNAQVEKVKRLARGYRNPTHFQTAIYLHCGGLDLYPRPQHAGATHRSSG